MYLLPALIVMTIYIIYPGLNTLYLSFRNANSTDWATAACQTAEPCWGILENYRYALTSPVMQKAFLNNLTWIVVMVPGTVILGLLIAALANGVRYEALAKAIIFLPMAISFVGAGVIWRFVYAYGSGQVQIGLLNALRTSFGLPPISWLTEPQYNNIALIAVGIWMWTGFCMTILAAAIKGVPVELMEAARVDGASEIRAFFSVTLPNIMPTVTVVLTTMVINVLKIFDIIYVMTGGNYGTEVIANRMYIEQYTAYNTGRASAIAVILILVIVPAMVFNIRRFAQQERSR
ncbi:MAG: sugar ABC transporter permease [Anaerolineae bacterium]|nr:sugar ABC transporter permease [Anaerolineae bacterium]